MPTEYDYQRECDWIDEIKMEEKLKLKENERFVTCGSCVKHIRKVKRGSAEPFFEKCAECIKKTSQEDLE